ncbi:MAG: hypothetical protein U0175_07050 [Caldilineaceae bacterium]
MTDRASAASDDLQRLVAACTGFLILGNNPLRFASTIGGTPLPSRFGVNAQGKCAAALGGSASILVNT